MRVVIAEKPSMGSAIAEALGLTNRGKGYIQGKDPAGIPTVCTWGIGHLVEAVEPEKYDPTWNEWNWHTLPMIPNTFKYQVNSKTKDQFDVVKGWLAKASEIVVATDAGREGELIAELIVDKAGYKGKALRLWAKSLTNEAVREAYSSMKPWSAYQGLRDAAYGRSMADWLVGLNGTRAMTLRARGLGRQEHGAWAIGRVMTPTLAILVERELEILNFVPKDYFTINATFQHPAGAYSGKWFTTGKDSFETQAEAVNLVSNLKGQPANVISFETNNVSKKSEQFYDLTTLQKEANKRFGFSSEKTLEVAQSLYEAKVLSYPRTGSRYLTAADAAKIPVWLKTLHGLEQYADFVVEIGTPRQLGNRYVDDSEVEDHTALMPTENRPNWVSLSSDQQKIYDLVARRFLAAFFPDRIEAKTVLVTEIQGKDGKPATFKTTGTAVVALGWSKVDVPIQGKTKSKKKASQAETEEEKPLQLSGAPIQGGDPVSVQKLDHEEKKTTPPKRMTEADLLSAMQSAGKDLDEEDLRAALKTCSGIGTPATRAATIEKLLNAGTQKYPKSPLVIREKNFLVPTEKGISLIEMLPFQNLRSAELTGRWETSLDEIQRGKQNLASFMEGIKKYTQEMVLVMNKDMEPTSPSRDSASVLPREGKDLMKCPKCKGTIMLKEWEGKPYTRCTKKDCYWGFDVDHDGNPTKKCLACGGRVRTTSKGSEVCADCGAWQQDLLDTSVADNSRTHPNVQPAGECPKCKAPLNLHKTNGGFFTACSDKANCGLSYDCDEAGKGINGTCEVCGGQIRKYRSGKKRCAVCDSWVNDTPKPSGQWKGASNKKKAPCPAGGRPPKPTPIICADCGNTMKVVWVEKRNKWSFRCDPCNAWM